MWWGEPWEKLANITTLGGIDGVIANNNFRASVLSCHLAEEILKMTIARACISICCPVIR